MATLEETRSCPRVQVSPEGNNHDVSVEGPRVGLDPALLRVDGPNRGLHEADSWFHQVTIGMGDGSLRRPAEHDIELGKAEDEAFRPVDQHDLDGISESVGEHRRDLQAAKPGSKYEYLHCVPSDSARRMQVRRWVLSPAAVRVECKEPVTPTSRRFPSLRRLRRRR